MKLWASIALCGSFYSLLGSVSAVPARGHGKSHTISASISNTAQTVAVPIATYVPAVHWDIDTSDLSNLQPKTNVTFMYGDPNTNETTGAVDVAFTNVNFKYPVVPLEHSAHVNDVTCTPNSITIKFYTRKAYKLAKNWPQSNFILAGHGYAGCESLFENNARFWALVSSHTSNDVSKTIVCTIQQIAVDDAAHDVDITWGQHILNDTQYANTTAVATDDSGAMTLQVPTYSAPQLYTYTVTQRSGSASQSFHASPTAQTYSVITTASVVSVPIYSTITPRPTSTIAPLSKRAVKGTSIVCVKDNLFRSFTASASAASSFCSSYLTASGTSTGVTTVTTTAAGTTTTLIVTSGTTVVSTIGLQATVTTVATSVSTSVSLATSLSSVYTSTTVGKRAVPVNPGQVWMSKYAGPALSSACGCISVTGGQVLSTATITSSGSIVVVTSVATSSTTTTTSAITGTAVQTNSVVVVGYSVQTTTLVQTITIPIYPVDTTNLTSIADFDTMLDDLLGYLDSTDPNFLTTFSPGYVSDGLTKRSFDRRFKLSLPSPKALISSAVKTATAVVKAVPSVANVVKAAANVVVKSVAALVPDINLTPMDTTLSISLPPPGLLGALQSTMYGDGYLLYTDPANVMSVYCVACGFTGSMHIKGQISYAIAKGFTKAQVNLDGNVQLSLTAAIILQQKQIQKSFEKKLITLPLSPFKIPGILSVGPQASFSIGAVAMAQASGGIQAGFTIGWTPSVVIDLLNTKNSGSTGLVPTFSPIVKLNTDITATLSAYVIGSLSVGVDVLGGKWSLQAGIYEKGTLQAGLTSQIDASVGKGGITSSSTCLGATVSFEFINDIYVAVDALGINYSLSHVDKSLPGTCIGFKQPFTSTSTSSTPTATPIASDAPTQTDAEPTDTPIASTGADALAMTTSAAQDVPTTTAPATSSSVTSSGSKTPKSTPTLATPPPPASTMTSASSQTTISTTTKSTSTKSKPKYTPPPLAGGGPDILPDFATTTNNWDNWVGAFEVTDPMTLVNSGTTAFKYMNFSDGMDPTIGLQQCKSACDTLQQTGTNCQSITMWFTASSAIGCDMYPTVQSTSAGILPLSLDPAFVEVYRAYNRPTGSSRKFNLYFNTTDPDYIGLWLGENGLYASQSYLYTLDANNALTYAQGVKTRKVCSPPNKPFDDILEYCYSSAYVSGSWSFDASGVATWTRHVQGVDRVTSMFTMRTYNQWNPPRVYLAAWWTGDLSSCGDDCDVGANLVRVMAADPNAPIATSSSAPIIPISAAPIVLAPMTTAPPSTTLLPTLAKSTTTLPPTTSASPSSTFAPVQPLPSVGSASCPSSNGTVVIGQDGKPYQVICGHDLNLPIIGRTSNYQSLASCLADCITWTQDNPGNPCGSVAQTPATQQCFLRAPADANYYFQYSVIDIWEINLLVPMASVPHALCPVAENSLYTSVSGAVFKTNCNLDYAGNDIFNTPTPSFEQCINSCAAYNGCVGVTYNPNIQLCFFKGALYSGGMFNDGAYSAALATYRIQNAVAPPPGLNSCPSVSGTRYTSNGQTFFLKCDADIYGGDITLIKTPDFKTCIDTCATTAGCVAVGYYIYDPNNQSCFLKNSVSFGQMNGAVGIVATAFVTDGYSLGPWLY